MPAVQLIPLADFPMVQPGDDLPALVLAALAAQGERLQPDDVVVLAQKIVSKSEGRLVNLADITPGPQAERLARAVDRDPRYVEVVLRESREVLRATPGIFVVEQRNGFICANAGVDRSNIAQDGAGEWLALLPLDPDASARRIRAALVPHGAGDLAVVINDTFGRTFREGGVGVALGSAGLLALVDQRGERDLFGYVLKGTDVATADEIAAAASLVMGQAAEAIPVVIVRGLRYRKPAAEDRGAQPLVRPAGRDVFRYPARTPADAAAERVEPSA